jgi:hypothetical protein
VLASADGDGCSRRQIDYEEQTTAKISANNGYAMAGLKLLLRLDRSG